MVGQRQLHELIDRIYDAALDPSHWPTVLDELVRLTRSRTGNIAEINLTNGTTRALASVGIPPKGFSDYEAYYWQKDIWTPKPGAFRIGVAYPSHGHIPDHVLVRSEFYQDWMKPLGLFHAAGGIPLVEENRMFLIGVHRPWSEHRPYEDREVRVLQGLFPHLKRALQIQNRLERAVAERDALRDVADRLRTGMIVCDAHGRIHWANQAGEGLCRRADGLTISKGVLTAAAPDETTRLARLIHDTVRIAIGDGQAASTGSEHAAGGAMLVSRPSGRRSYVLLVGPLRAAGRRLDEQRPAAAVFISDPEDTPELPEALVVREYGLTPAEWRLAESLLRGQSVKTAADQLRRSHNTARAQLKQIFQKTGTRRQAELIRLLLGHPALADRPEPFPSRSQPDRERRASNSQAPFRPAV
ncbi:MAG: hypothetical protein AB1555_18470 [Nitrospirota bacterium]